MTDETLEEILQKHDSVHNGPMLVKDVLLAMRECYELGNGWIKMKDKEPTEDQWCLIQIHGELPVVSNYKRNNKFLTLDDLGLWELEPDQVWRPCPLIPENLQSPLHL